MENISELPRSELESLLKGLKKYRLLQKKLWKRAKGVFENTSSWVRVELAPGAEASGVAYVLKALKIDAKDALFTKNDRLSGGARIFIGDDLIALSYNDIIQKI